MNATFKTQQEAADFLRVSPRTLERKRQDGSGPKYRKFGARVVYSDEDLGSYVDSCLRSSTSDPGPST